MWKTDYLGIHEKRYQQLRTDGSSGWSKDFEIQEMVGWLEKALLRRKGKLQGRVLELGCGSGNLSLALAKKGWEVYGIDIAPSAIKWANDLAKEQGIIAKFVVGDVRKLPYENNFFDLILDGHCLHCIIGEHRKDFLTEALRVLKAKGLCLIMTMCNDPVTPLPPNQKFDSHLRFTVGNGFAGRYYGQPENILKEVENAGFSIEHWMIDEPDEDDSQEELIIEITK